MAETSKLIDLARQAQAYAYTPYSHYNVGAALLTNNGNIYSGSNIENTSYGLTVCAERIAVFKAVTAGEKDFNTIIITASGQGFPYPCGACLQVLAEFSPGMKIIVVDEKNDCKEFSLKEMLPQIFMLNQQEG